jgi:hypothetical protein
LRAQIHNILAQINGRGGEEKRKSLTRMGAVATMFAAARLPENAAADIATTAPAVYSTQKNRTAEHRTIEQQNVEGAPNADAFDIRDSLFDILLFGFSRENAVADIATTAPAATAVRPRQAAAFARVLP